MHLYLMGGCKIEFVTSLGEFYETLVEKLGRKCFGGVTQVNMVGGLDRHFWDSGRF